MNVFTTNPYTTNPFTANPFENPYNNGFCFEARTTAVNETFTLPLESGGTYDFHIDWGDGSSNDITVWNHADTTHIYANAGTYDIKITGTITGWKFNNSASAPKVYEISSWGSLKLLPNSGSTFYGCSNMTWVGSAIGGFDTPLVTNMSNMLRDCCAFNQSISKLTTPLVTNMYAMLYGCDNFNQSLFNFDTPLVENMAYMLCGCLAFDQDISHLNVSSATDMISMLRSGTLSTANYDALILAFSADVPSGNYTFGGGNSQYTAGGAVEAARIAWVNKGWTLTDGGGIAGEDYVADSTGETIFDNNVDGIY